MTDTLNIGITCYPTIGGSGIVATELGLELARRGHKVHFISYEPPFRLHGTERNIWFHKVNINEYALFKYPDYTLPLAVMMEEVHARHGLDILHVHYAVPHATAGLLARQIALQKGESAPRVVTTLHGTDITLMGMDPTLRPIIEYSINQSCGVTAVSRSLKDDTHAWCAKEKDIEVIYNFFTPKQVTRERKEVRQELGIRDDEIVVLHSSNLRKVKRVPDLLRCFAQARLHGVAMKLVILAGGSFEPYEALVDEQGIREAVRVVPRVREIGDYMNAADIGLYPSEDESFGMGILETMAYGKPVIASRVGGIPEVVADGVTGSLVTVGDIEGFAREVMAYARDAARRGHHGAQAAKRAAQEFSAEKIVDRYVAYYRKVMQQKGKGECE